MLSVAPAASSKEYYDDEDYYEDDGHALSMWAGQGAHKLGLEGEVARDDYQALYRGKLPNGVQLGTYRHGQWQHYPGWDPTFSAPKSVSLLAEVAGDRRLVEAHNRAVLAALAWLEREASYTRIRRGNKTTQVRTGNLVAAVYRHDLSRALEPQLHSHAVVMNVTQDAEGTWRSLDGRHFFALAKQAGIRYQQALARHVGALGYEVQPNRQTGTFEIEGVPRELIEHFSTRTREIEAWLKRQGLDRASASTLKRKMAAVRTRARKGQVDRAALAEDWRETMHEQGVDLDAVVRGARSRASQPDHQERLNEAAAEAALDAVRQAADKLAECDAVFADDALQLEAGLLAFGRADAHELRGATNQLVIDGTLQARTAQRYNPASGGFAPTEGWTTADAIRAETAMLAIERQGRRAMPPALTFAEAKAVVGEAVTASAAAGHRWTIGQRAAAEGLLTSSHLVTGVQGYAGTAKTTTVLATYAGALRAKGYEVHAMAPTLSAAETLGRAVDADGITLDRHLTNLRQPARLDEHGSGRASRASRDRSQAWIVDEASMISAKRMRDLLRTAEQEDARIAMVGDVHQLASVEAGRAFGQLQEAGMTTYVLDEIVRQHNLPLRVAVYDSLRSDAANALERLDRGGGTVIEIAPDTKEDRDDVRAARLAHLADRYAALTPTERERTVVIEPSREGRIQLNAAIRERLAERGELVGPAVTANVLQPKGLTKVDAKLASSYEPGDIVRFETSYGPKDRPVIQKDAYLRVAEVDAKAGRVMLQKPDHEAIVWRPAKWGGGRSEAYRLAQRELCAGDLITWTRNNVELGAVNGRVERVIAVDPERQIARLDRPGGPQELDLRANKHQHWDWGRVRTVHTAQGLTADRVYVHLEPEQVHLVHQRSFYTSLSRAKQEALLVTSDRSHLIRAIEQRSGAKAAALDGARQAGRAAEQAVRTAAARAHRAPPRAAAAPVRISGRGIER